MTETLTELIDALEKSSSEISKQPAVKIKTWANQKIKVAQEQPATSLNLVDLFCDYLGLLKANQIFSQTVHWTSKGENFYGDHLLFERIYDASLQEIDGFAEKAVGIAGEESVNPIKLTEKALDKLKELPTDDLLSAAVKLEEFLTTATQALYTQLKEAKQLTLGMDDLLMKIYDQHEENLYLIKQRLKT